MNFAGCMSGCHNVLSASLMKCPVNIFMHVITYMFWLLRSRYLFMQFGLGKEVKFAHVPFEIQQLGPPLDFWFNFTMPLGRSLIISLVP